MVFSSTIFLFIFLPITILLYFIPKTGIMVKNTILLIASLFFYTWGEMNYVIVMLVSIIINYILGILINKNQEPKKRKLFLIIGIVLNLIILGHFKYTNFIIASLNDLLSVLNIEFAVILKKPVHLPIGISFFTFQAISYIVDVYRKTASVRKNPVNLALYIALFPQLIAGPIIRYSSVSNQIRDRKINSKNVSYGIQRFIIGLGKKVIVANNLGYIVDQIFLYESAEISTPLIWFAMILYGLQIFYDFSGYSDMAIGLGRIFGFKFLENFNYPYIAKSLRNFWQRWHISLSSWFKDYLYIPLGGNKKGNIRTYFNLFTVFFLCGLWHGASWNFIIWGLFHGLFLTIERFAIIRSLTKSLRKTLPSIIFNLLSHLYLITLVTVSWVFFKVEDFQTSTNLINNMFVYNKDAKLGFEILLEHQILMIILPVSILLAMPINRYFKENPLFVLHPNIVKISSFIFLISILLISIILIGSNSYNPFIYFQF